MRNHVRKAMTLIELLVVIATISILIGLLLPAIQRVRNAVARAECSDRLRQIGLACHHHIDTNKALPTGVRYNRGKDHYPFMTWLTQLLPFVEQGELWRTSVQAYGKTINPFQNPPHAGLATTIP